MQAIVQHFIGTTDEWETTNPILYEAVWGFEKTTEGKIIAKLGDGVNSWNDLKYFDQENIFGLSEKIQELENKIELLSSGRKIEKEIEIIDEKPANQEPEE